MTVKSLESHKAWKAHCRQMASAEDQLLFALEYLKKYEPDRMLVMMAKGDGMPKWGLVGFKDLDEAVEYLRPIAKTVKGKVF